MRYITNSLGLLCLLVSACGSDDGDSAQAGTPISCDWFTGDNCWRTMAASARSCVNQDTQGTLSADRKQCEYDDGTVITSTQPMPTDLSNDTYTWDVTVTKQGQSCVTYREIGQDGGMDLITSQGTFSERIVGMDMVLICPDGQRYAINGMSALDCGFADLPGTAYSYSDTFASLTLIGTDPSAKLLDCRSAQ